MARTSSPVPASAALRRVPLFERLGDDESALLADRCRRRRFRSGEALFREGDPGWTLHILVAGHVNIERAVDGGAIVHIARRGPGEAIGEMALLDDLPRSADAVADGDCETLALDRPDLLAHLRDHPDAAWAIIRGLSARLREATDRILGDGTRDVLGRVAAVLLDECRNAPRTTEGHPCLAGLSDSRIAVRIGASRETVNRRMAALRKGGVVRRTGAKTIVLDVDRLQDLRDRL
ncbi:MAG: Crp/Fnr family transcriptional regulator [Armatimonadota bacterium]